MIYGCIYFIFYLMFVWAFLNVSFWEHSDTHIAKNTSDANIFIPTTHITSRKSVKKISSFFLLQAKWLLFVISCMVKISTWQTERKSTKLKTIPIRENICWKSSKKKIKNARETLDILWLVHLHCTIHHSKWLQKNVI